MTFEAHTMFGWPFAGIGNRLRTHPLEVKKLSAFRVAVEEILQSNVSSLTTTPADMSKAVTLAQQFGLLANDAILVAMMQANGLTKVASSDADLDRVPGISRYAPV